VIQDKKSSNKFSCAICREKQSVRKVLLARSPPRAPRSSPRADGAPRRQIFHSSDYPKDCRVVCQGLNMERGLQESIKRDRAIGEIVTASASDRARPRLDMARPACEAQHERKLQALSAVADSPSPVHPDLCRQMNGRTAVLPAQTLKARARGSRRPSLSRQKAVDGVCVRVRASACVRPHACVRVCARVCERRRVDERPQSAAAVSGSLSP
jgi:hypothetical protein